MYALRLALRYLWGRKLRTVLTTLAIVLGVAIIFGLNGLSPAMKASFTQSMTTAAHQVELVISRQGHTLFDSSLVEPVRETPGLAHALGVLSRDIFLPEQPAYYTSGGRKVDTFEIYGLELDNADKVLPLILAEGRLLQPGDRGKILISENLAEGSGLGLGDTIQVPSASGTTNFEITGILTGRVILGKEEVFVPLADAQEVLNLPGQINAIAAKYELGADEQAVKAAVLSITGPDFETGGLNPGTREWEQLFQMADVVFTSFGMLALAMGGFILFNTFRTVVVERRREIGMLRAIGASRRTVMGIVLAESLLQGLVGTSLGLLSGYLLAAGLMPIWAPYWEQFLGTPPGDPAFTQVNFALSIGLGLGMPLLSVFFPARAASRISPLEALRPSMAEVEAERARKGLIAAGILTLVALLGLLSGNLALSGLGALLFLVVITVFGPVLVVPISRIFGRLMQLAFAREGHLAQGNLARQPGRAAITVTTIAVSLAILVALAGLGSTFTDGMMSYLDKSMRADYLMLPESTVLGLGNVGAGPGLAETLGDMPGIDGVTSLRRSQAEFNGSAIPVIGIDPVTYPELSGLIFAEGDPDQAYPQLGHGRSMIANSMFAATHRVGVGDEVLLDTPAGPQPYRIAAIGIDYLNSKLATVYISHDNLQQDFRESSDVLLMVNRSPDADPIAVESMLLDQLDEYPAFTLISYERWRETQLAGNQARNLAMYVLVALLAVPSLLALANTLGINVLERRREIGLMRAVGATRPQVGRMILAESLLLSALGISFGLLAGLWLGYLIVQVMNLTGFVMPYYFPYTGMLVTIAVGLLFGVLAALIPARQAARLDIIQALELE